MSSEDQHVSLRTYLTALIEALDRQVNERIYAQATAVAIAIDRSREGRHQSPRHRRRPVPGPATNSGRNRPTSSPKRCPGWK